MQRYDLEERCTLFTRRVHKLVRQLPKDIPNIEVGRQLVRSAGSVGANYIEANEALSKKDFAMRVKISKKEAKETCYWLSLLEVASGQEDERSALLIECTELMKILGAILVKTQ